VARSRDTFPCPACHADVVEGALACPSCGADARTGWGDDDDAAAVQSAQELDLPTSAREDDEAYEEFVRGDRAIRTTPPSRTAILLIVLVVLGVAAALALLTSTGKP
jgi:hypothetical protein